MKTLGRSRTLLPVLSALTFLAGAGLSSLPAHALKIPTDAVQDLNHNTNEEFTMTLEDGVAPAYSSNDAPGSYDSTHITDGITVTITFSEPVQLGAGAVISANDDVTVGPLTAVAGDATQWTVKLTLEAGIAGPIVLSLQDDAVRDDNNNSFVAVADFATINDGLVATVTDIEPEANSYTFGQNFTFTVTFSEPIPGLGAGDFDATNADVVSAVTSDDGQSYTVTVDPWDTDDIDLAIADDLTDSGGNSIPVVEYSTDFDPSGNPISDNEAPAVSDYEPRIYTSTDQLTISLVFNQLVSGLKLDDFSIVSGTDRVDEVVSATDAEPTKEYTIKITPIGSGEISLHIPADNQAAQNSEANSIMSPATSQGGQPALLTGES